MPNPNAIVSSVLRIEGDTVHLGNRRRVRVDPEDARARGYLATLSFVFGAGAGATSGQSTW